jgi:hypothetical protein
MKVTMKYVNRSLFIIILFSATISKGMQFGNLARQTLRRSANVAQALNKCQLPIRRSFNAGIAREASLINASTHFKPMSSAYFPVPKRHYSVSEGNIEEPYYVSNYNLDKRSVVWACYDFDHLIEQVKESVSGKPVECGDLPFEPKTNSFEYFKYQDAWLERMASSPESLQTPEGRDLVYRAIINIDAKLLLGALKLGFDLNQKIKIKEKEYTFASYFRNDKFLKIVLEFLDYQLYITQIINGDFSNLTFKLLEYILEYENFITTEQVFNAVGQKWFFLNESQKKDLRRIAEGRFDPKFCNLIEKYIHNEEDFLKHY